MSTRQIAHTVNQPNISHVKAWRILKRNNYKPFKLHISQKLMAGDPERRLQYCMWLRRKINENPYFLSNVLWSDECKFTNCGMFNRKNEHIWSVENPRGNREIRKQVRFSVNVWAGIYNSSLVGPFIFHENLNGERYLQFLNTTFQEYVDEIPLARLPHLWFQQDGAPPHNTRAVKLFLNEHFPNRWIGNGGAIEWPARSPDISPLDFFLWGALQNFIYKNEVGTPEELERRIRNAFGRIRRRSIERTVAKIERKIEHCIQQNGNIFEHLEN